MKKVYGSYLSTMEARKAVDELLEQGYSRDEIKVVSNKDLGGELQQNENDVDTDHRSLWEKIKDAFTFDEYNDDYWDRDLDKDERTILEGYKTNLQAGEVVVLIEEGSSAFRDHFRDGVPDWDERENEFNESSDEEPLPSVNKYNLPEDKNQQENIEINTGLIDESSLNNQNRDPLRNDNLNDRGLVTDELSELDRKNKDR